MTAASVGGGVGTDASLPCAARSTEVDVLTFSVTGFTLTAWKVEVVSVCTVDAFPEVVSWSEWPGCSTFASPACDDAPAGSFAGDSAMASRCTDKEEPHQMGGSEFVGMNSSLDCLCRPRDGQNHDGAAGSCGTPTDPGRYWVNWSSRQSE